jgi:hypothetical protein
LVHSENHVEVESHVPVIISEELTISRVGSVGMYFKRVERVRDIGNGNRRSQSVFGVQFDILRDPRVRREIHGKARAIGFHVLDIILVDIDRLGKTAPTLNLGINFHLPWQGHAAPGQKPVGKIACPFRIQIALKGEEKSPR